MRPTGRLGIAMSASRAPSHAAKRRERTPCWDALWWCGEMASEGVQGCACADPRGQKIMPSCATEQHIIWFIHPQGRAQCNGALPKSPTASMITVRCRPGKYERPAKWRRLISPKSGAPAPTPVANNQGNAPRAAQNNTKTLPILPKWGQSTSTPACGPRASARSMKRRRASSRPPTT